MPRMLPAPLRNLSSATPLKPSIHDLPKPHLRPMLGHASRGGGIIGSKRKPGKAGYSAKI